MRFLSTRTNANEVDQHKIKSVTKHKKNDKEVVKHKNKGKQDC